MRILLTFRLFLTKVLSLWRKSKLMDAMLIGRIALIQGTACELKKIIAKKRNNLADWGNSSIFAKTLQTYEIRK